ncbi:MAG: carboxypeptidase regulatory-like domain-containing protein [candidate division KSB1 bacterium]|nr:carboxypeptidase regulatory-like domain-containing protein [candidate division KSB1 bacterium]
MQCGMAGRRDVREHRGTGALSWRLAWKWALMAALMFPASWPASAQRPQTYTLRGQIVSLVDGLPLPGIRVQLKGTSLSAVTDSTGTFVIRKVPQGAYELVAKYPDFEATILKNILIPPRKRQSFVFTLNPVTQPPPLPLSPDELADSLAVLEGRVRVVIDTFRTCYEKGWLVLKAVVAGRIIESYLYPQRWRLLPAPELEFRFLFVVPAGKIYHLYLLWQEEGKGFLKETILHVFRQRDLARRFDLKQSRHISDIRETINLSKIWR